MIWLLMFVGFCFYMAVKTSRAGGGAAEADMYLPQELRRQQDEMFRQQNQQFMDESMKFSMDSVTPMEHGGLDTGCGNSFNDFGAGGLFDCGGFFDGGFGGLGL